MQQCNLW